MTDESSITRRDKIGAWMIIVAWTVTVFSLGWVLRPFWDAHQ